MSLQNSAPSFTSNEPITDIDDNPAQHFEAPDALNEQDLIDNHLPKPIFRQPHE